ncbi:MAG: tryptophan--tRNA ligase [Patescibacteria group bacterium]
MTEIQKPVAVSGIQCSGDLHLGNYLGAIKQFIPIQETHNSYFFIADLHALTEPQDPDLLTQQTLEVAAMYLAAGLDSTKVTLFVQSHVREHVELGWILNTITPIGELERMTQFKDKSSKSPKDGILAGLLNYPTLMAADILLYQADVVPVGEDQLQHLELTRTLARKFNSRFENTFKEPQALTAKIGARILGLDDPTKKMSKSASSKNNYIGLLDTADEIRRKIKIAVTDSDPTIKFDIDKKLGISNLLSIYSLIADVNIPELETKYQGKSYTEFKSDLAEAIIGALAPIQQKYHELAQDPEKIMEILKHGAKDASKVAGTTMQVVRERVGLLS